jgi:hypothetical protein
LKLAKELQGVVANAVKLIIEPALVANVTVPVPVAEATLAVPILNVVNWRVLPCISVVSYLSSALKSYWVLESSPVSGSAWVPSADLEVQEVYVQAGSADFL